jgi:hypothetical protein
MSSNYTPGREQEVAVMSIWNDDMDAAPKDGTQFLAWDCEAGCVCIVRWPTEDRDEAEWEVHELETLDWIAFGWHLSKWTPLPQPDWLSP